MSGEALDPSDDLPMMYGGFLRPATDASKDAPVVYAKIVPQLEIVETLPPDPHAQDPHEKALSGAEAFPVKAVPLPYDSSSSSFSSFQKGFLLPKTKNNKGPRSTKNLTYYVCTKCEWSGSLATYTKMLVHSATRSPHSQLRSESDDGQRGCGRVFGALHLGSESSACRPTTRHPSAFPTRRKDRPDAALPVGAHGPEGRRRVRGANRPWPSDKSYRARGIGSGGHSYVQRSRLAVLAPPIRLLMTMRRTKWQIQMDEEMASEART